MNIALSQLSKITPLGICKFGYGTLITVGMFGGPHIAYNNWKHANATRVITNYDRIEGIPDLIFASIQGTGFMMLTPIIFPFNCINHGIDNTLNMYSQIIISFIKGQIIF